MCRKSLVCLPLISLLLAGCSHRVDGEGSEFYVLINPDNSAGIYLDGEKIADAKELVLTKKMSEQMRVAGKDGDDPKPFDPIEPLDRPYTAPKPKPCGDMPCPRPDDPKPPSPSPTPACHTPDCGRGSYYQKNNQLIIYRDSESRSFPQKLKMNRGY